MRQLVERLPEAYQLRHPSRLHDRMWERVPVDACQRANALIAGHARRRAVAEDLVRLMQEADPSRDWGECVDVCMRFKDSRVEWWRVDVSDEERGPVGEFCNVDWLANDIREDTP